MIRLGFDSSGQGAHPGVLVGARHHVPVAQGVEQTSALTKVGGQRWYRARGEPRGLVGGQSRVVLEEAPLVEGADDRPEAVDDGCGEVAPIGGEVRVVRQGRGVAVVLEQQAAGIPADPGDREPPRHRADDDDEDCQGEQHDRRGEPRRDAGDHGAKIHMVRDPVPGGAQRVRLLRVGGLRELALGRLARLRGVRSRRGTARPGGSRQASGEEGRLLQCDHASFAITPLTGVRPAPRGAVRRRGPRSSCADRCRSGRRPRR